MTESNQTAVYAVKKARIKSIILLFAPTKRENPWKTRQCWIPLSSALTSVSATQPFRKFLILTHLPNLIGNMSLPAHMHMYVQLELSSGFRYLSFSWSHHRFTS